ncbi:hypothetical protein [Rubinisphaera sp.]|uniref:hypothetical protein n=1 Tax=Rubinisphaera sp. TaxID=2024857 RepID=UPI000C120317|nr:hypothetical protein [Rubinisphaera sp.]MBV10688.1 hypothetical protein [Rubinisphaera sp.]|tara:strand:- start:6358 stop:7590 length:1233 start_codon:yes stop_codon:yes gene_type:complete
MIRWWRTVLPSSQYVGLFVLAILTIEAFAMYDQLMNNWRNPVVEIHYPRDFLLIACAFAYGIFRASAFSPFLRNEYRDWLLTTPWRYGKPLPLGPLRLIPQDVFIVLFLVILGLYRPPEPQLIIRIPFVFLFAYTLCSIFSFVVARHWFVMYVLAFGLTSTPLLLFLPFGYAEVAIVLLYTVAWLGFREILINLPVQADTFTTNFNYSFLMDAETEARYTNKLGNPFDQLRPDLPPWQLPRWHGVMISLLIGTFYYSGLSVISLASGQPGVMDDIAFGNFPMMCMMIFVAFGVYLVTMTNNHLPPLSLLGRLRTGRLLIPSYDRVYSPALGILTVVSLASEQWWNRGQNFAITSTACLIVCGMCLLVFTPNLAEWQLTSSCRIGMGALGKQSALQAQQQKKNDQQLASSG